MQLADITKEEHCLVTYLLLGAGIAIPGVFKKKIYLDSETLDLAVGVSHARHLGILLKHRF